MVETWWMFAHASTSTTLPSHCFTSICQVFYTTLLLLASLFIYSFNGIFSENRSCNGLRQLRNIQKKYFIFVNEHLLIDNSTAWEILYVHRLCVCVWQYRCRIPFGNRLYSTQCLSFSVYTTVVQNLVKHIANAILTACLALFLWNSILSKSRSIESQLNMIETPIGNSKMK